MSSTPIPRVRESFEGRGDENYYRQGAAPAPTRLSVEDGPKSPNAQVTESVQRPIFGRLQLSVLDRLPDWRGQAPRPPPAPGSGSGASLPAAPQLPPPPAAPSEFPGLHIRPQTAASNYSSRGLPDEADTEISSRRGRHGTIKFQQWWKRPELKTRVIILFVWTILLLVVVSLYLGLAINRHLATQELHVALILIILISAMFFCHSLIRLCVIATKPYNYNQRLSTSSMSHMGLGPISYAGPLGYAQPAQPIPIQEVPGQATAALLDDNDDPNRKLPAPPPAYGLWRQSVRVNPNQFYWVRRTEQHQQQLQRNASREELQSSTATSTAVRRGDGSHIVHSSRSQETLSTSSVLSAPSEVYPPQHPSIREEPEERRPPSYASADRVQFEESARSMVQQYEQAAYLPRLPIHPSERGRAGEL